MRTFARHTAGVIVGFFSAWLSGALLGIGIDPEAVATAIEGLEILISGGIMLLGYFVTEKGLKHVKKFFPDAWAEMIWKRHAGESVKHLTATTAKSKIESGQI